MIKKTDFLFIALLFAPALCCAQEALLGGMVQSDRWIIRKDKMEEEFSGNVSYKNNIYDIRADYGLSNHKEKTFDLRGRIRASMLNKGNKVSLTAERFFYDRKRDKGFAVPAKGRQLEISYKTINNNFKAYADRLDFSEKLSLYKTQGNCELDDINNTLYADKMEFNQNNGVFNAEGGRPVLWGFREDGDYAIQADTMTAHTQDGFFKANGRVRGWVVSAKQFPNLTQGNKNGTKIL